MIPGLASRAGVAVPLQSIALRGELLANHALLRFVQTYRSDAGQPLEAIYTFPLPAEGAVVDFRYRCGDRELVGELKEREQAFHDYDEAVREGHGAALVERERADVFTASVGNLLPGETVEIEVEVLLPLDFVDGRLRLKIPTLVPPRYVPGRAGGARTGLGAADPTDLVPDADRITPATAPGGDPGYAATLDLRVALGYAVVVDSPSHGILAEQKQDRSIAVRFAAERVALDRDLVLTLHSEHPLIEASFLGGVYERTGKGPGTFAFGLVPQLGGERAGRRRLDVVFVLDRSGSMGGASIVEARRALAACLRHLRTGDRFEIVAFDTEIETFSTAGQAGRKSRLVDFSEAAVDAARSWIAGIDARGGTELGQALDVALPLVPGGTLVLLTDAQVGDEELIAARVAPDLAAGGKLPRVFAFGIGTNIAGGLLTELARATGGAVEEIHPGESIEEKVLAQFARAVSVRVEALEVAIDGVETTDLVPSATAFTDGEPYVLLGRYPKPGGGRLTFTGVLDGEAYELTLPIGLPAKAAPLALPRALTRVWAARRVAALERERAALGNPRRAKLLSERIVALSLEHRVLCRETAFVVVEKREGERLRPGLPQTVVVPVHAPAGWEMTERDHMERRSLRQNTRMMRSSFDLAICPSTGPSSHSFQKTLTNAPAPSEEFGKLPDEWEPGEWPTEGIPDRRLAAIARILTRQRVDGLWNDPGRAAQRGRIFDDIEPATQSEERLSDDLGLTGDDRLLAATLARLYSLLLLEASTLVQEWQAPLERALRALFALLDRWPGTDRPLVELALRLARGLDSAGLLAGELDSRLRAAHLEHLAKKHISGADPELERVADLVATTQHWEALEAVRFGYYADD